MSDPNGGCDGEILFAHSYGGLEDYTFTSSVAVTAAWLESVKDHDGTLCETNNTVWMNFKLTSAAVLGLEDGNDEGGGGISRHVSFVRKYCYREFCKKFCGYFGMTAVFHFLDRFFSPRHKRELDAYDMAYASFVDSILQDVGFIVCMKRPRNTDGGVTAPDPSAGVNEERLTETRRPSVNDGGREDDYLNFGSDEFNLSGDRPVMIGSPYSFTYMEDDYIDDADELFKFRRGGASRSDAPSPELRRSDGFVGSPAAADEVEETYPSHDRIESSITDLAAADLYEDTPGSKTPTRDVVKNAKHKIFLTP